MLSIITINRNHEVGVQKTIDSLCQQLDQDYRWIFIDGNSGDKSVAIAKRFARHGDIIISEADTGIYNAMNKGIKFVDTGPVIFINSGDIFYNQNSVLEIKKYWDATLDVLLFGFQVRGADRFPKPTWWRFWSLPTSHQATIYNATILKNSNYDERYRYAADFEHFLRIFQDRLKVLRVRQIAIINEPYGCDNNLRDVLAEYKLALQSNGCSKWWAFLVFRLKTYYLSVKLR